VKWLSSAPANLMLMGEHSVVYGQKAIAAAVDKRLTIEWETRQDNQVFIDTEFGEHQTYLDDLRDHQKMQWVTSALRHFRSELNCGLNISIKSDFKSTVGLGSSAAVLAAMIGGIYFYLNRKPKIQETFQHGLKIIHEIQGRGSGTDLAASLSGGLILFDPRKHSITSINHPLSLYLIYAGYKTPTAKVLETVAQDWKSCPEMLDHLYQFMGKVTEKAFQYLEKDQYDLFYQMVNRYQGLLDTLGVNDLTLSKLIYELRDHPMVYASKISGSGLGDCVVAFGELETTPVTLRDYEGIPIQITDLGLHMEQL